MNLTISEQKKILTARWKLVPLDGMSEKDKAYYQSMAKDFYNKTNDTLNDYIKKPKSDPRNAWLDVENRITNTYLVVDNNVNKIVLYFSLCCGMIYSDIFQSLKYSSAEIEFLNTYRQALTLRDNKSIRELSALAKEFELEDSIQLMNKIFKDAKQDRRQTKEGNLSLFIAETYPGIELTHFCKNDQYFGKPLGITLKSGAFIFWEFVVKEVKKLTKISAAKYLYLYAAESPATRKLVPYYKEHLYFEQMSPLINLKTIKPYYDYNCISMLEEISQLDENRKLYYSSLK